VISNFSFPDQADLQPDHESQLLDDEALNKASSTRGGSGPNRSFQAPGYDFYGVNATLSTWNWWNDSWNYRIAVIQNAMDFDRSDIVTRAKVNFTEALSRFGDFSGLDENSIRVVEYNESGDMLWETPSQLKKERDYDSFQSAEIDVVWMLNDTTPANKKRFFFIYFDSITNGPKPPPSYPAGTTNATEAHLDGDGDLDEFTLNNSVITFYRKQSSSDVLLTTDSGADGYLYHKGIGSKIGTGFRLSEMVFNGSVHKNIRENNYPSVITKTVEGPLFSEVIVEILVDPAIYPGHMYEVYRIYEDQGYIELNLWLNETPDYTISMEWHDRRVYHDDIFDRMYGEARGDEPLASVWHTSQQYLLIYNSTTSDSFGFFTFKRGNIRAYNKGIFDSYFYSADGFEYHFLWAAGGYNDVNNTFRHFMSEAILGVPEDHNLNIVLPPKGWLFSVQDPIPIAVTHTDPLSNVSATIYKTGGSSVSVSLQAFYGNRLFENLSGYNVIETDPEGTWNVTASATTIYGNQTISIEFEVRQFQHPKAFINKTTVQKMRSQMNTSHEFIWTSIKAYVDSRLPNSPLPELTQDDDVRSYEYRIEFYALAYLLTQNETYAQEALEWMMQITNYTSWQVWLNGPDLQISHFIMGLAIGYDWLYDYLTPIERHIIRERVLKETQAVAPYFGPKGGGAALGYYLGNHGQIDNTAIAVAAYVFDNERYQGVLFNTSSWKELVANYYNYVYDKLFEDGSCYEGAAYWSYGLQYIIRYTELVRFAGDADSFQNPYLLNTSLFRLHFMMPDRRQIVNYGDAPYSGYARGRQCLFKLASANNDTIAQWLALNAVDQGPSYYPWDYIWYDETVNASSPEEAGIPLWHHFPVWDVVVGRTSWDTDAQLFAFKSASPVGGHDHPDQNSFILFANGEHLAVDLGYTYNKETENHNTILVNLQGQVGENNQWMRRSTDPDSNAEIVDFFVTNHSVFIWGDAHKTYPPLLNLTKFDRDIVFVNQEYYVIHDDLASRQLRRFDWLLHTYGEFSKQGSVNWIQEGNSYLGIELFLPDGVVETVEETWYVPNRKPPPETGYNDNLQEYQNGHFLRARTLSNVSSTNFLALLFPTTNKSYYPTIFEIDSGGVNGFEITPVSGARKDYILFNLSQAQATYGNYSFVGRCLVVTEGVDGTVEALSLQNGSKVSNGTNDLLSSNKNLDISISYETSWAEINLRTFPMDKDLGTVTLNLHFDGLAQVKLDGVILDNTSYTYDNMTGNLTLQLESGFHNIILYRTNLRITYEDVTLNSQHVYYGDTLQVSIGFDYFGMPNTEVKASIYLDEMLSYRLLTEKSFLLSDSGRIEFQHDLVTKGILGDHELIVELSWNGSDWIESDDIASSKFSVRGWDFRIPLSLVNETDVVGLFEPCTVEINLTSALVSVNSLGRGPVDIDSLRLVQVNSSSNSLIAYGPSEAAGVGGYRKYEIPLSFTPDTGFDPDKNAKGNLSFFINGTDEVNMKQYYIYFDTVRNRTTYPGPTLSDRNIDPFQLRFDIEGGGRFVPGWVYAMSGTIIFEAYGSDDLATYYINLTHASTGVQVNRTFIGGFKQDIIFEDIPDGVWNMTLQKTGDRDPYVTLGCDGPIIFDRDASQSSTLLSEPSEGSSVLYFYVPTGTSSFDAYEYHYDENAGYARFIMKDASGMIMDDNLIPLSQQNTSPTPRPIIVPPGSDGQVWSLTVEVETIGNAWDDFYIAFSGIPTHFSPTPEKMFLVDYIPPTQNPAEGYQIEFLDPQSSGTEFLPGDILNVIATTNFTSNPSDADSVWVDVVDSLGNLVVQDFPLMQTSPMVWEASGVYTFDINDAPGNWTIIVTARSNDGLPTSDMCTIRLLDNYTLLKQGWNLISIPYIQKEQNLTKVLEIIDGYYDAVQWYDIIDSNDPWKHYKVGKPYGNDLFEINETMGFWIHITNPGGVLYEYLGTQPTQNQTIPLHPGWNLVGYPSLTNYNRTDGLNNLTFGTDIDAILSFDAQNQRWEELGENDYFKKGKGYWVHSLVEKTWEVPI